MPKILFIITQSEMGGAQRYLLTLAQYLGDKDYEIAIAAGEGDGELFTRIKNQESRIKNVHNVKHLVRNLNPIKDFFALISLLKIVQVENPDVVFLQSTKAGFLGSLAVRIYNLKANSSKLRAIYRIGGWSFRDPRSGWMNKILFWMEKISARWKDVIIVNSEFDRTLAIDKKICPPEKIVTIYNGIDPTEINFLSKETAQNTLESRMKNPAFAKASADRQELGESIIVGTIANLYATKGLEYLIEAASKLAQRSTLNTVRFVVIGEGKERAKLEVLIEKYRLQDHFSLIGRIENAAQYLKAFDIFILPSVKEGMPWVILEAMAAELPVIATSVGAVPEIIKNNKNGLLVPPKDSQALADALQQLFDSTSRQTELATNARDHITQFSRKKMLEESETIITNRELRNKN